MNTEYRAEKDNDLIVTRDQMKEYIKQKEATLESEKLLKEQKIKEKRIDTLEKFKAGFWQLIKKAMLELRLDRVFEEGDVCYSLVDTVNLNSDMEDMVVDITQEEKKYLLLGSGFKDVKFSINISIIHDPDTASEVFNDQYKTEREHRPHAFDLTIVLS